VKANLAKVHPAMHRSKRDAENLEKELPQPPGAANFGLLKKQIEYLRQKIQEDEEILEDRRQEFFDALEILNHSIAPDSNMIKARQVLEDAKVELGKAEKILERDKSRLNRLSAHNTKGP